MFKRLKEKKELEEKFGSDVNLKATEDYDNNDDVRSGAEDSTVDDSSDESKSVANSGHQSAIDILTEQLSELSRELAVAKNRSAGLETQVRQLSDENRLLTDQIAAKTEECLQLKSQLQEYQSIGAEKDELLMRNAELSSRCQQMSAELKNEQKDRQELSSKCDQLQRQLDTKLISDSNDTKFAKINETVVKLEQSLLDKNKTIKLQEQRLRDMKKTFLKNQNRSVVSGGADDQSNCSSGDERSPRHEPTFYTQTQDSPAILRLDNSSDSSAETFQYLRNVVFKYMVNSDYEVAAHLVRAISVLLKFTKDEERLIKETIDWKTSWIAPLMAPKPSLHSKK